MPIAIGKKTLTRDGSPLTMAEIGVNHDGDVRIARKLIDAAHAAGADAVKFQLFDADLLLARNAGLVKYQRAASDTAGDLLRPLQLSPRQMQPLIAYAQARGLAAVVTPFSPALVPACVHMGVDAIKLASPDLVNYPLLLAARATRLPLILSTGAATMADILQAARWLGDAAQRTAFLHCVSSYPTPSECAALGAIAAMRDALAGRCIGYSDHTQETLTGALAVFSGACLLEKHLTLSRQRSGPDHAASLEPGPFAEYVRLARHAFTMRGPRVKQPSAIEMEMRQQARQSVATRQEIPAGTVLSAVHLTVKRPGTGIPAANFYDIIGRTAARNLPANSVLAWRDLRGGESR